MLFRGADDGCGAAYGERAHLAGAGALHDQPRRRRCHPRQRRVPAAHGSDLRQDTSRREARADQRRWFDAGEQHRLRGRVRVDARSRDADVPVPASRREHAGDDVLHDRHHRAAEGRLLQPSPARAAHAGDDGSARQRAARDLHGARRLHADHADVPRPRLGASVRRDDAGRQAGLPRPLCAGRAARTDRPREGDFLALRADDPADDARQPRASPVSTFAIGR